jgi:hypothetical protein
MGLSAEEAWRVTTFGVFDSLRWITLKPNANLVAEY